MTDTKVGIGFLRSNGQTGWCLDHPSTKWPYRWAHALLHPEKMGQWVVPQIAGIRIGHCPPDYVESKGEGLALMEEHIETGRTSRAGLHPATACVTTTVDTSPDAREGYLARVRLLSEIVAEDLQYIEATCILMEADIQPGDLPNGWILSESGYQKIKNLTC